MKEFLFVALKSVLDAGLAILKVYNECSCFIYKKEGCSPLTEADLISHKIIASYLSQTDYPILSEEGKNILYRKRRKWKQFWLVDPLDGTKEFIKRNGEFTVNVALVENGSPILGIVYAPVFGDLYFALSGMGAYKAKVFGNDIDKVGLEKIIKVSKKLEPDNRKNEKEVVVVASRSHMSEKTIVFIEKFKKKGCNVKLISKGSSLKLCLVAEGKADIYPRFAPTMEWDTAAGQAIVEISGGKVIDAETGEPLKYNKENLLNPPFIAVRKGYEF